MPLKHQTGSKTRKKAKRTYKVRIDRDDVLLSGPKAITPAEEYEMAKIAAHESAGNRRLIRVRTRNVLVSGMPFAKAKPYANEGDGTYLRVTHLRREFIFAD